MSNPVVSIEIANTSNYIFTNTTSNYDVVVYPSSESQRILFGTKSNVNAGLLLSSSNISMTLQPSSSNNSFSFFGGNSNLVATILSSGNVGLGGKTYPQYPLDVLGTINATALYINGSPLSAGTAGGFNASNTNTTFTLCNVGIGKSNPSYPLDVVGNINFTGALMQNGSAYIGSQWSNNGSNLFISGSNVGIGTSTPQQLLHVSGNLQVDSNLYLSNKITMQGLSIVKNSNLGVANVTTVVTAIPGYTFNSNNSNVGINNSDPQYQLDIVGSGRLTTPGSLLLENNANNKCIYNVGTGKINGTSLWTKICVLSNVGNVYASGTIVLDGAINYIQDGMRFRAEINVLTQSAGQYSGQLMVDAGVTDAFANGSFDIVGYADSNYNLHMYYKASASYIVANVNAKALQWAGSGIVMTPNTTFSLPFTASNSQLIAADSNIASGYIQSQFSLNSIAWRPITTRSNVVGINNSNPQSTLDVAGNINCTGNISAGNLGMFRNRVINGDMRIAQRGTSLITGTGTSANYIVDRNMCTTSITTGGITQSNVVLTSTDTPYTYGFRNSWRTTASTACTSYSYIQCQQNIEAYNMSDFNWGTTAGVPVTLSFWMRTNMASGSGIPVAVRNGNANSTYWVYTQNITATGGGSWQYVSTTIPAPPSSSIWNSNNNSIGMEVVLAGFNGNYVSANTWTNNGYLYTSSSTNVWMTLNNYVEFTGLQLEKGTIATPFEFRPYATELQLCQRYFNIYANFNQNYDPIGIGYTETNQGVLILKYPVEMRANPSIALGNATATQFLISTPTNYTPTSAPALGTPNTRVSYVIFPYTGLTGGAPANIRFSTTYSAGCYLGFNAEL